MNKLEKGEKVRVRFAPSPTGKLHIGTARTALFNWLFARHERGRFILRIEDTDKERSKPEYETAIVDSLRWLGLDWDEGPGVDGGYGPYKQSERLKIYREYADKLMESGHAYHCYCTQSELEEERRAALAAGRMPMYGGRCRHLSQVDKRLLEMSRPRPVIRFKVKSGVMTKISDLIKGPITINSSVIGDFIIMKNDGMPTYNFAAAVDDMLMRVTHVLRGEDHITNTVRQIMLLKAMGGETPKYGHFSMILGTDKAKLSKRHGAAAISEYRRRGYLAPAVINYLSLLSWSPPSEREIFTPEEIIAEFSLSRVSKSPAIFDQEKLDWFNGRWLREMSEKKLAAAVAPYLKEAGYDIENYDLSAIAAAIKTNLTVLGEAPKYAKIFFEPPSSLSVAELKNEAVRKVVRTLSDKLSPMGEVNAAAAGTALKETVAELKSSGLKGRQIYHPLRLALTGRESGPELYLVIAALGRERTLARLRRILNGD